MVENKNKTTESSTSQAATLRRQAEDTLLKQHVDRGSVSPEDAGRVLHELKVHQIELEMQNEELRRAQVELEALRARYFDLYDLAPVGYCTISEKGLIIEANLTAASLLGIARGQMARPQIFSRFILKEDQDSYYLHCKKLFATDEPQAFELRMLRQDGAFFWVRMEATKAQDSDGAPECRAVISDITSLKQVEEALKKSENYFFTLFEKAPLGYQSLDEQGRFILVNQTWLETLGYERDEVIGKWFGDFLAPEFVEPFRTRFPIFKAEGKIHSEFQMLHKNGSRRFIAFEGRIGYQPDGSFQQTHCILSDFTLRKEAEEILRRSEEKYRTLFEGMSQGAFYQAADGSLTDVNPAALRIFGLTRQEFSERTSHSPGWKVIREDGTFLSPDEHPSMAALRTGIAVKDMTVGIFNPLSNTYVWVIVNAIPQFLPGESSPIQVYVTMHDITERIKLKNELLLMSDVLSSSLSEIYMFDAETLKFQYVNYGALHNLGYSLEEIKRLTPLDLKPELTSESFSGIIMPLINGQVKQQHFETFHRRADGSLYPVEVRLQFFQCYDTGIFLAIIQDITERRQAEEILKQSEYRQRVILNTIPDIAWLKDLAGTYIAVNEAFAQAAKRPLEDIPGKKDQDLWPPELAEHYRQGDLQVVQTGQRIVLQEDIITGNGETLQVESIKTPFYDNMGNMIGTSGIARDITVRMHMEESLKKSSQKWRNTFDAIVDPVSLLSLDGTIEQCNQALVDLLNLDFESVIGKKCHQLIYGTDDRISGCPTAKVLESGRRETMELQFGEKHLLVIVDPVKDSDGKISSFVHIMRDITSLKQSENSLAEQTAHLCAAERIAHVGSWQRNLITGELIWSDETRRIFGWPLDKPVTFDEFMLCVHPDDSALLQPKQSCALAGAAPLDVEYRIIRPDGEIRSLHERCELVYDSAGQLIRLEGFAQDITEGKQAKEAVQAKNAELERFTYSISHDLRSPLVTIRTFMGHLVEDMALGDQEHVAQDLGYINTASQKMVELLDELLQLSRIGRMVNPSVEVQLQEIVQEALFLVAGRIDERGVRVTVTEKPLLIFGDRVRLVEVFQNLVDNAAKFMGEQPEPLIEIGAEKNNGGVICCVRDNGMGIEPRHTDKLFGLFEKLNSGMEGFGLGLALVKRIIEAHGGKIWAESEGPGKGACFWFTLPRKSSES